MKPIEEPSRGAARPLLPAHTIAVKNCVRRRDRKISTSISTTRIRRRATEPRRWFRRQQSRALRLAGLAALLFAIVVNAVFLQDQRHAAPCSDEPAQLAPLDEPVAPPLPAPARRTRRPAADEEPPRNDAAPPVEVGRNDPIGRAIAQMDQQPPARVKKPKVADAEARRKDDRSESARGFDRRSHPQCRRSPRHIAEPDAGVMAAQRADKLGFVIRPDGYMGGTTRQAINASSATIAARARRTDGARQGQVSKRSGVEIR